MITTPMNLYTAALAIWILILALRVIALRGNPIFAVLSFGRQTETRLDRAIRGHGNLIEYAPIFLILLWVAQSHGVPEFRLHAYGIAFCLGRLLHGTLFCFLTTPSVPMRVAGMTLTLTPTLLLAIEVLRPI